MYELPVCTTMKTARNWVKDEGPGIKEKNTNSELSWFYLQLSEDF